MRTAFVVFSLLLLSACKPAVPKAFAPPNAGFSAQFPAVPTEQTIKAGDIDVRMFAVEIKPVTYYACYNEYAASTNSVTPEQRLDGARDGAVSNIKGTLIAETEIMLDNYPGRDIQIASMDNQFTIRTRMYMVNNRLYQIAVVTAKDTAFTDGMTAFLDSFKLLGK